MSTDKYSAVGMERKDRLYKEQQQAEWQAKKLERKGKATKARKRAKAIHRAKMREETT